MGSKTNVLQEWEVFTFTDVVEVNPKRSLKKGEECQYIEVKSLLPNHRKVEKIDKRAYKGGGSRFRNGDTLFARITPCLENGKIAFVNELDHDQAGYGSTEFIVMSGKEGVTDNLFVYYLSRWDEIRDFAIKNMTGTSGRQRVPNDIFKQKKIYFPPLPEQRRIASTLSAFDDKIELNNQMNRTLEEMASAIFSSWFVDFEPFRDEEFEYNEELDKERGDEA
jgi:type I restriction enzyme S subunit